MAIINGDNDNNNLSGDSAADTINGYAGDDYLVGNGGNDTLTGGADNDYLQGDAGADTYVFSKTDGKDEIYNYDFDNSVDTVKFTNLASTGVTALFQTGTNLVIQYGVAGQLTVAFYFSSAAYRVDNFQFTNVTWTLADIAQRRNGTADADTLSGFDDVTNTINGLGGADTLTGGNLADNLNGGVGDDSLTGDAGNDVLVGGDGIDSLTAGTGNDTLTGGADNDYMQGDAGADTYVFSQTDGEDEIYNYDFDNSVDTVEFTDLASTGVTAVLQTGTNLVIQYGIAGQLTVAFYFSSAAYRIDNFQFTDVTWTLADIAQRRNGTADADTLSGFDDVTNTINGLGGADTLTGGNLADNLDGGEGDDNLTGNAGNDILVGGDGIDSLTAGAGNDTLTGGADNDYLQGDAGIDTYLFSQADGQDEIYNYDFDNSVDTAIFNDMASTDITTIFQTGTNLIVQYGVAGQLTVDFYFSSSAYRVDVFQFAEEDDTLTNFVVGTENSDNLIGTTGNDAINGLAGADTLEGNVGNDLYFVDNVGDTVQENLDAGKDTVKSSVTYTLAVNVENLILTGASALNGTGNTLKNVLTGNAGANILNGLSGADTMIGGLGNDNYFVDNAGDAVTETSALATEIDKVNSTVSYTLGANLENLTLIGAAAVNGTGNALKNVLTGNAAANTLNGAAGADKMNGGLGNDTYMVDHTGDVVTETSALATEIDTVKSAISYTLGANLENLTLTGAAAINGTGNALKNVLTGNDAVNILNGAAGADTMIGGLGNDSYFVDNVGDVVTETSASATEIDTVNSTVSYTLGANLENLTLNGAAVNGTGNTLKNVLTGNSAANTLDGAAGADTMIGGLGNDGYFVDNVGDVVTETSILATEIDTVNSAINYTLGANLENLTLIGAAAVNGTGNALNNVLTGNAAANTLDGAAGADTMIGGLGNDGYFVDNVGDVVTETSILATEIDTVNSTINYSLGANLENLNLTGAAVNGTGNALNNILTGNAADNRLSGGSGADKLKGGEGADLLIGGTNKDTYLLAEKVAATDTLRIAAGDSLVNSFDVVSGFKLGIGAASKVGVDKLDLPGAIIAADAAAVDGIDSGIIRSHSIVNGVISFDDTDSYATALTVTAKNLSRVFSYLENNITTADNTVIFNGLGNTYLFQDNGANDTLIQLTGVTADSLSTSGFGANAVWIA